MKLEDIYLAEDSDDVPTDKELYNRVKREAKEKFDAWPSRNGSAWLVTEYKRRGGSFKTKD